MGIQLNDFIVRNEIDEQFTKKVNSVFISQFEQFFIKVNMMHPNDKDVIKNHTDNIDKLWKEYGTTPVAFLTKVYEYMEDSKGKKKHVGKTIEEIRNSKIPPSASVKVTDQFVNANPDHAIVSEQRVLPSSEESEAQRAATTTTPETSKEGEVITAPVTKEEPEAIVTPETSEETKTPEVVVTPATEEILEAPKDAEVVTPATEEILEAPKDAEVIAKTPEAPKDAEVVVKTPTKPKGKATTPTDKSAKA